MENFDRADEKARTEEQKERLTRMFAALSATNEAIMRAKSRAELFELVCEAAANGGMFTSTTIALADPASDFLVYCGGCRPDCRTHAYTYDYRSVKPLPRAVGSAERHSEPGKPASAMII